MLFEATVFLAFEASFFGVASFEDVEVAEPFSSAARLMLCTYLLSNLSPAALPWATTSFAGRASGRLRMNPDFEGAPCFEAGAFLTLEVFLAAPAFFGADVFPVPFPPFVAVPCLTL